ncbi:U-scoloptoxin(01)-Cw1a-like [Ischnura elegans]|uniref:U-scoloptoxin(01)-Cw1a-like n=1 Tax=Ischnura elegans TaxID=197161 RepID=UPI001ED8A672|nr:U-scoloptoxin(01)-Cw1a-like [Ischnura elegans]
MSRLAPFVFASALVCLALALLAFAQNDEQEVAGAGFGTGFPTYAAVPRGLQFTCNDKQPGYYADPEAQCQVWHWCLPSGSKFSFLCPNGTVFNQVHRVCDWWFNVDCPISAQFYSVNNDLYKDKAGNPL